VETWVEGRDHESGDHFISTGGEDIYLTGATLADQDFIAAARQDIPALIAAIRESAKWHVDQEVQDARRHAHHFVQNQTLDACRRVVGRASAAIRTGVIL
jgi:ABC-type nitrate/sulfonate/bicarbonate transport system substrate-binding protein